MVGRHPGATLCGFGSFALLYVAVIRELFNFPGANYAVGELLTILKNAAPSGFAPMEGIPVLAMVFGLPAVGILLIHRHERNAKASAASSAPTQDAMRPCT